jgi:hypothetical protein
MTKKTAKHRYHTCRAEALARNIEWQITYEEWYDWWLEQGYDREYPLPNTAHGPCMCRKGDTGPYHIDNIYMATRQVNSIHREMNKPSKRKAIKTPWGEYPSMVQAAKSIPISPKTIGGKKNYIRYHCQHQTTGWAFI